MPNFMCKYDFRAITILDLQNISLFFIACSSLGSYLYYHYAPFYYSQITASENTDYTKPFHMLLPVVGIHAFADLIVTKSNDLKIHHLCIFGVIFYNYYYNVSPEYSFLFLYPLLKTEISSIFLVLKYWLPNNTNVYFINMILFYLSFIKFRIYDFYNEILYCNISFDTVFQKYSFTYSMTDYILTNMFSLSCYVLFFLNIYWFLLIDKILYKIIAKMVNINTDILCHLYCSYTYLVNIPLAVYIYSYAPDVKNVFDITGVCCLSVTSYVYHYDSYCQLHNKKIEIYDSIDDKNMIMFFNDAVFIHIRSFLVIVTSYYYSEYIWLVLFISGIVHIVSIYYCIVNILGLYIDNRKNNDIFWKYHNIITIIPIACYVILFCMHSTVETRIPFIIVNVTICFLLAVEPFYKLTHVAFHLLLIAQKYYMCWSNVNNTLFQKID